MSLPTNTMAATSVEALAVSLRRAALEQVQRTWPEDGGVEGDRIPVTASDSLRVGMDLVLVADVAASVARLGRRYLYRVFTPHERACARLGDAWELSWATDMATTGAVRLDDDSAAYSAQSLAARFAAKEAAVKVLRPRGARPEWRCIEVHRAVGGWCELRLSGRAALLAAEAGITTLAVSVTHEPMMAAACVVAMSRGDAAVWHRKSSSEPKGA